MAFGFDMLGQVPLQGHWPMVNAHLATAGVGTIIMDPLSIEADTPLQTAGVGTIIMNPLVFATNTAFQSMGVANTPVILVNQSLTTAGAGTIIMDPMPILADTVLQTNGTGQTIMDPLVFQTSAPCTSGESVSILITYPTLSANVITDVSSVNPMLGVTLVDPNNTTWTVSEASYTQRTNAGHQWGVKVSSLMSTSYDPEGKWFINTTSRKGPWKSPPLALSLMDRVNGDRVETALAGSDFTSWRLGTAGFASPSFQYQTTEVILDFIALFAQQQALYVGSPFQYPIEDYTIHGGTLMSHMAVICHDFGWQFRIGPGGQIIFYPIDYNQVVNRPYLCSNYNDKFNPAAIMRYLRLIKQSKAGGFVSALAQTPGLQSAITLPEPWNAGSLLFQANNINGQATYAAAYDASNALCQFKRFSPLVPFQSPTSSQPAVSVIWDVEEPTGPTVTLPTLVRLIVSGKPVGPASAFDNVFELNTPAQVPYFAPLILGANEITYNLNAAPPKILNAASINYIINNNVINGNAPLVINSAPDYRLKIDSISSSLWPTIASMNSTTNGAGPIIPRLWTMMLKDLNPWIRSLSEVDPNFFAGELVLSDNRGPAGRCEVSNWRFGGKDAGHTLSGYNAQTIPGGYSVVPIGQQV